MPALISLSRRPDPRGDTTEKTAFIRRMLFGSGSSPANYGAVDPDTGLLNTDAYVNPHTGIAENSLVTPWGASRAGGALTMNNAPWDPRALFDPNSLWWTGGKDIPGSRGIIGDMLFGRKDVNNVLKARYQQGGLFGKGGYFSGQFMPNLTDTQVQSGIRALKGLNPFDKSSPLVPEDVVTAGLAVQGNILPAASAAFNTFSAPVYEAINIYRDGGKDKAKRIGGAIGGAIGGNFFNNYGMVPGAIGAYAGNLIGRGIGTIIGGRDKTDTMYSGKTDIYGRPLTMAPLPPRFSQRYY